MGWLFGWLVGCAFSGLVGWLDVACFIGWLVGCWDSWFVGSLIGWLVGCSKG